MVKEIIESNNWERPIYFAVTCSEDSKIGLQDYLKMEGMGLRLVPEKRTQGEEFINPEVMKMQLLSNDKNYYKDYNPGFKFRGLNDEGIFFDENHRRMTQNYRNAFFRLAIHYVTNNQNALAVNALDEMEKKMPRNVMPMEFGLMYELSNIYYRAGGIDRFNKLAVDLEKEAWEKINADPVDASSYWNPYRVLLDIYENQRNFRKAYEVWQKLSLIYPGDPTVKTNLEKYRILAANQDSARTGR